MHCASAGVPACADVMAECLASNGADILLCLTTSCHMYKKPAVCSILDALFMVACVCIDRSRLHCVQAGNLCTTLLAVPFTQELWDRTGSGEGSRPMMTSSTYLQARTERQRSCRSMMGRWGPRRSDTSSSVCRPTSKKSPCALAFCMDTRGSGGMRRYAGTYKRVRI